MIKKVAIIGAGGVGSHTAFSLLQQAPPDELVLIDVCDGLACGVGLDLEDTRGFLDFTTDIIGTSEYRALEMAEIVVITAGVARKSGMSRLDLLKTNAAIVKDICDKIKKYAPQAIVIVVTNPLDYITYIVKKTLALPRERVMGMGSSLDTSRLLNIIHNLSGASASDIEGFVYGQHSPDMIVNIDRIRIKGRELKTVLAKDKLSLLVKRVQSRGTEIVQQLKTKSACFGPAVATAALIKAIGNNSNAIIPVSAYLEGEYDLRDICLGVPCVINRKGIDSIVDMQLSQAEKEELQKVKKEFELCMI